MSEAAAGGAGTGAVGAGGGGALSYRLTVNGRERDVVDAWIGESLLHVLRERLALPGSKSACEQGECGSCSVLVDATLVCSCLVLAAAAVGRDVRTVESLPGAFDERSPGSSAVGREPLHVGSDDLGDVERDVLSDVQRAFFEAGAVQCGFCTPGLVMTVHDLLRRQPRPDELEIREAISGNLCRCTGYGRILAAVERVVGLRRPAATRP